MKPNSAYFGKDFRPHHYATKKVYGEKKIQSDSMTIRRQMLYQFTPPSNKAVIPDDDTTSRILRSDVEEIEDWVVDVCMNHV